MTAQNKKISEAFPDTAADLLDKPILNASLEEVEKQHIARILKSEPNYEKAADILGITPATLWRKRKKYKIL